MAYDSRVISAVNITDGHQETQRTWIEHDDGFFAEKDAMFRAENLEDFVDLDVATCFFFVFFGLFFYSCFL